MAEQGNGHFVADTLHTHVASMKHTSVSTARWIDEDELDSDMMGEWRCQKRARALYYNVLIQIFFILMLLADIAFSIYGIASGTESWDSATAVTLDHMLVRLIILFFLAVEIILNIVSHGARFFRSKMSIFEIVFLITCIGEIISEIVFYVHGGINVGIGRVLRQIILVLRLLRRFVTIIQIPKLCVRIRHRVDEVIDAVMMGTLRALLGNVLHIPPDNITSRMASGHFRLEKVNARTDVLGDIPFPLVLQGGIIELFDVRTVKLTRKGGGVNIMCHNVCLVFSPDQLFTRFHRGKSLQHLIRERKANFVDLVGCYLDLKDMNKKKAVESENGKDASGVSSHAASGFESDDDEYADYETTLDTDDSVQARRRSPKEITRDAKRKVTDIMTFWLKGAVLSRFQICNIKFSNISIEYGEVGKEGSDKCVWSGIKLGSLHMRAEKGIVGPLSGALDFRLASRVKSAGVSKNTTRIAAEVNRVSMWWDVENKNEIHKAFFRPAFVARDRHKRNTREKFQAAVVRVGGMTARHRRKAVVLLPELMGQEDSQEDLWFKETFSEWGEKYVAMLPHRYLMLPTFLSIHVTSGEEKHRLSGCEVDMLVKDVIFRIDRLQLESLLKFRDSIKQWMLLDQDFQWRPPCRPGLFNIDGSGKFVELPCSLGDVCQGWWHYAVRIVLRRVLPFGGPSQWIQNRSAERLAQLCEDTGNLYMEYFRGALLCPRQSHHRRKLWHVKKTIHDMQLHMIGETRAVQTTQTWNEYKERSLELLLVALPLRDIIRCRHKALIEVLASSKASSDAQDDNVTRSESQRASALGNFRTNSQDSLRSMPSSSKSFSKMQIPGKAQPSAELEVHVTVRQIQFAIMEAPPSSTPWSQTAFAVRNSVLDAMRRSPARGFFNLFSRRKRRATPSQTQQSLQRAYSWVVCREMMLMVAWSDVCATLSRSSVPAHRKLVAPLVAFKSLPSQYVGRFSIGSFSVRWCAAPRTLYACQRLFDVDDRNLDLDCQVGQTPLADGGHGWTAFVRMNAFECVVYKPFIHSMLGMMSSSGPKSTKDDELELDRRREEKEEHLRRIGVKGIMWWRRRFDGFTRRANKLELLAPCDVEVLLNGVKVAMVQPYQRDGGMLVSCLALAPGKYCCSRITDMNGSLHWTYQECQPPVEEELSEVYAASIESCSSTEPSVPDEKPAPVVSQHPFVQTTMRMSSRFELQSNLDQLFSTTSYCDLPSVKL